MALIEVIRERPPAYAHCKGEGCGKLIEWVTTVATGRRMPVTAPLRVERVHEREDGRMVTVLEGEQAHFNTCPGANAFRKSRPSKAKRQKLVQADLFPGERT